MISICLIRALVDCLAELVWTRKCMRVIVSIIKKMKLDVYNSMQRVICSCVWVWFVTSVVRIILLDKVYGHGVVRQLVDAKSTCRSGWEHPESMNAHKWRNRQSNINACLNVKAPEFEPIWWEGAIIPFLLRRNFATDKSKIYDLSIVCKNS